MAGERRLRERAAPGAWPSFVPAALARRIDGGEPLFASPALRVALARRALDDGELALATRRVAQLPPSLERSALEGRLAELRGDGAAAARDFLAAGDSEGVARRTQALADAGQHRRGACTRASSLPRVSQGDPSQVDALADSWLSIGRLEQAQAYRLGTRSAPGRAAEQRAADAYARAVELAPLSERYLISAGSQALNLGELSAATAYFTRARDADPASGEAYAGLGEAALRRGDARRSARGTRARRALRSATRVGAPARARTRAVRIGLDAQLAVGTATGIGEYVSGLLVRAARTRRRRCGANGTGSGSVALRPARALGSSAVAARREPRARRRPALRGRNAAAASAAAVGGDGPRRGLAAGTAARPSLRALVLRALFSANATGTRVASSSTRRSRVTNCWP